MPSIRYPICIDCDKGEAGGVWRSEDLPFEQARGLSGDHIRVTTKFLFMPCPLDNGCDKGEEGGVWRTMNLPYRQAKEQVDNHMKFAHQDLYIKSALPPRLATESWRNQ